MLQYEFYFVELMQHAISGEAILRKRIQELQHYRRMGLRTVADIERYDADVARRVCALIPTLYSIYSIYTYL